jgi:hypothetical protein
LTHDSCIIGRPPQPDLRAALRLVLLDMNMGIVVEAADWPTTLALAPETRPELLLVDWELIAVDSGNPFERPLNLFLQVDFELISIRFARCCAYA